MRSLILFGVLALCFIVALGDIEQESEAAAVADVLVREAREARRPRKKSQKPKRRKSQKSKRKGKGKRKMKPRNGGKKSSRRNNNGKKNRSDRRNKQARQGTTCDMSKVKIVFNLYTKSSSLGVQAKRAAKFAKQVGNKFSKCGTEFVNATTALGLATTNGTTCAGEVATSDIQNDFLTLKNCSVSSCDLCDLSSVGVTNETLAQVATCETELKNVSDTAAACLRSGECSCLDTPPTIPETCDPFVTTTLNAIKGVKDKCTDKDEKGSFTNCAGLVKATPGLVDKCGKVEPVGPPSTATARARDLRGMFNKMML